MLAHIRYTDNVKPGFAGQVNWFIVKIRPAYRDDKGLLAHEMEHVRHWWAITLLSAQLIAAACFFFALPWPLLGMAPLVHGALYKLPRFRLWSEVQCYAVQIPHYPDNRTRFFAGVIASKYGLDVSVDEAERMLKKALANR